LGSEIIEGPPGLAVLGPHTLVLTGPALGHEAIPAVDVEPVAPLAATYARRGREGVIGKNLVNVLKVSPGKTC